MVNKILGGILLIIGTSIGASILALPLVTAAMGFAHASLLLLATWAVMTVGAYLVLEVTLWMPQGANLISMARMTLGRQGEFVMWTAYLLLLYALLSAFMAGGGDLMANVLALINVHLSTRLNILLFAVIFGAIVADGIRSVDWANRGLMSVKLIIFVLLIILIAPHIDSSHLIEGSWAGYKIAFLPILTSFGYAIVMPSLCGYFKGHIKALRLTIAMGSLIPLVCYLFWNWVIQGSIQSTGTEGLIVMAQAKHAVSDLVQALSVRLNSYWISSLAHIFAVICVTTSFLAVSLCLNDFLVDGLKLAKNFKAKATSLSITFLPPLLIVLFYPGVFIKALSYAGICCAILLMLLPALMCYSGRYFKKIKASYQVWGGPWLLLFEIVISIILLGYGIMQVFL